MTDTFRALCVELLAIIPAHGTGDPNSLVIARARAALEAQPEPVARPEDEYHEDMGAVLWWRFPIDEPPYCGSPLDSEWPGYHTHFTPLGPMPIPANNTNQEVFSAAAQWGATCMTELSPQAQAVLDAVASQMEGGWISPDFIPYEAKKIAAALRAAADRVLLMRPHGGRAWTVEQAAAYDALTKASDLLNAIAAELDAE